MRGVPEADLPRLVDDVLLVTELGPHAMKRSSRLSGGMKRKLCTALSLVGNPSVVSHFIVTRCLWQFAVSL